MSPGHFASADGVPATILIRELPWENNNLNEEHAKSPIEPASARACCWTSPAT
jgi:hypothetical protein